MTAHSCLFHNSTRPPPSAITELEILAIRVIVVSFDFDVTPVPRTSKKRTVTCQDLTSDTRRANSFRRTAFTLSVRILSATMMDEPLSPFDQALSRPFLQEQPVKKRWSVFTQSTATASTASSSSVSSSANDDDDYARQGRQRYTAPIVEIVFSKQQEEVPNEEGSFVLARALEEGRVVDVNQALMTERHHDISHIHSEMQQLNAIQRELAVTVENQQDDVERMCYMAVESAGHAEMGLEHLVQTHRLMLDQRRNKRRATMAVMFGLGVVATMHWAWAFAFDEDGSPEASGFHP